MKARQPSTCSHTGPEIEQGVLDQEQRERIEFADGQGAGHPDHDMRRKVGSYDDAKEFSVNRGHGHWTEAVRCVEACIGEETLLSSLALRVGIDFISP